MTMTVTSPAFAAGAEIPRRFTCEGADTSVPLTWSGAPAGTKSFVLIADDPDAPDPLAPTRTYVHWVLYDIPATVTSLAEGASLRLPSAVREGVNDWTRSGWGGPCPPVGRHRYFFTVVALDAMLGDLGQPDKAALLRAMQGHELARGELVGTYQKAG